MCMIRCTRYAWPFARTHSDIIASCQNDGNGFLQAHEQTSTSARQDCKAAAVSTDGTSWHYAPDGCECPRGLNERPSHSERQCQTQVHAMVAFYARP